MTKNDLHGLTPLDVSEKTCFYHLTEVSQRFKEHIMHKLAGLCGWSTD